MKMDQTALRSETSRKKIRDEHVEFERSLVRIIVRPNLNNGHKHGYNIFLGPGGMNCLREYLEHRISQGEIPSDEEFQKELQKKLGNATDPDTGRGKAERVQMEIQ